MLRLAGKILGGVLTGVALIGLYLTLVIAQPQEEPEEKQAAQPVLPAAGSVSISGEDGLRQLMAAFPAPVMSFMSGSGMVFVKGEATDVPCRGAYGRKLTLYWQTAEGVPVTLQSYYPADAVELMGMGDYSFSGKTGPALFGRTSVRMENRETIRVHVLAEGTGLYVLTVPAGLAGSLSDLSRSIQLFADGQEETAG